MGTKIERTKRLVMLRKIALIQAYIHHIKGVEVDIRIPMSLREIDLLDDAYRVAKDYFYR